MTLRIIRVPHTPAAQIGYSLDAVRVVAHMAFRTESGWTTYRHAIVDTGAAVSLLPAQVWQDISHQDIGSVRVGGIIARDDCRIAARLATVICSISDGIGVIGPLTTRAYLAETNEVPLLLGVCDLIENGVLHVDIRQNDANFEQ